MRAFLRAKIHKATVTEADVSYVGSVTIDPELLDRVGILEYEKVLIVSNTSGERLETYALRGEPGSGQVCINGGAALRIKKGEEVIVMAFEYAEAPSEPRQILVDRRNRFVREIGTEVPAV
jgi:aspartate 1-decarboxylase